MLLPPGFTLPPGQDPAFKRPKAPLVASFVVLMTSRPLSGLIDGPSATLGLKGSVPGSGCRAMSEGRSWGFPPGGEDEGTGFHREHRLCGRLFGSRWGPTSGGGIGLSTPIRALISLSEAFGFKSA